MKKLITLFLLQIMICNFAVADCDFSIGVVEMPNHTYQYSPDCHLKVGQLVQSDTVKTTQITNLTAAIQLKDLALTKADERITLWRTTSYDEVDRMDKIESNRGTNNFLYFGLGALTVLGAGWMASRLLHP